MGDCKDNMKTTVQKDSISSSILGLLPRKRKKETAEVHARTFADTLEELDKRSGELILSKQIDLQKETGREEYNRKALAILNTIQYHIDEMIEQVAQYSELK